MGRSQSTPGLVESRGRIPLEDMWVPPVAVGFTPIFSKPLVESPPRITSASPGESTSSERSHHNIIPGATIRSGECKYPVHLVEVQNLTVCKTDNRKFS